MSVPSPTTQTLEARVAELERRLRARPPSPATGSAVPPRSRPRRILVGITLGLVLASMPLLLMASHEPFTDVSDAYIFHQEIGDLYNARIVTGTSATTYGPSLTVQRGAMAAFIHRAAGRSATNEDSTTAVADGAISEVVATLTIKSGGVGGGTGFLLVTADATLYELDAGNCPCTLGVRPQVNSSQPTLWSFETISDTGSPYGGSTYRFGSASETWVIPVSSGTTNTVNLLVAVDTAGGGTVTVQGHVSAVYIPLGSTGGNTLSVDQLPSGSNGLGE